MANCMPRGFIELTTEGGAATNVAKHAEIGWQVVEFMQDEYWGFPAASRQSWTFTAGIQDSSRDQVGTRLTPDMWLRA